jgi:hypothetical protein
VVEDATNSPSRMTRQSRWSFKYQLVTSSPIKRPQASDITLHYQVVGTERLVESVFSEQNPPRRSGMLESKRQVEVDQLAAECNALRQHLDDLRLLVVDLVKENQLLRDRLFHGPLRRAADIPTEQEIG